MPCRLRPPTGATCSSSTRSALGPWELAGEGRAPALARLRGASARLLLVVRRSLLADVRERFEAEHASVLDIGEHDPASLAQELGQRLDLSP